MAEAAKITPINDQSAQAQTEKTPDNGKRQLPGESALWFRRYCLYRDLGHKRSLRAAVAKEQETAHLVKETEPATKSTAKQKKEGDNLSSSAQKQSKPLQVPGSWKNACKVYRWAERTANFDQWIINRMVTATYDRMGKTYANKYKRVQLLEVLIKGTLEQSSNATNNGGTHEIYLAYVKQIAALLRQMESEMEGKETEMRIAIEAYGRTFQDDIEKAFHLGQTTVTIKEE